MAERREPTQREQQLMDTLQAAREGLDEALMTMVRDGAYAGPPQPVVGDPNAYTGWHPDPNIVHVPDTSIPDNDIISPTSDVEELAELEDDKELRLPEEERGVVIGMRSRPKSFLHSSLRAKLNETKGQRENRIRESKYFTKRKTLPPKWTMRDRSHRYMVEGGLTPVGGPLLGDNTPMYKYYFVDPYGVAQNHPPPGYNHPVDQDIYVPSAKGRKPRGRRRQSRKKRPRTKSRRRRRLKKKTHKRAK